jgi:hypothetical protein
MLRVKREDSISLVQITLDPDPSVSTNSATTASHSNHLCYRNAQILATVLVSHLNLSLTYSRYKLVVTVLQIV